MYVSFIFHFCSKTKEKNFFFNIFLIVSFVSLSFSLSLTLYDCAARTCVFFFPFSFLYIFRFSSKLNRYFIL